MDKLEDGVLVARGFGLSDTNLKMESLWHVAEGSVTKPAMVNEMLLFRFPISNLNYTETVKKNQPKETLPGFYQKQKMSLEIPYLCCVTGG